MYYRRFSEQCTFLCNNKINKTVVHFFHLFHRGFHLKTNRFSSCYKWGCELSAAFLYCVHCEHALLFLTDICYIREHFCNDFWYQKTPKTSTENKPHLTQTSMLALVLHTRAKLRASPKVTGWDLTGGSSSTSRLWDIKASRWTTNAAKPSKCAALRDDPFA